MQAEFIRAKRNRVDVVPYSTMLIHCGQAPGTGTVDNVTRSPNSVHYLGQKANQRQPHAFSGFCTASGCPWEEMSPIRVGLVE
jgi:hypothetical protein